MEGLKKKDVMTWAKGYLKLVAEKLTETNPERVPEFKKGSTALFKFIVGKFDEFQIYSGKSMNMEAGYAFSFQES